MPLRAPALAVPGHDALQPAPFGPPLFAWRYERTSSLWIYASVAEVIAAVEAVLSLRAHRPPPVPNRSRRRRSRPVDPHQLDLLSPLRIASIS